jgi:hypothetical protein
MVSSTSSSSMAALARRYDAARASAVTPAARAAAAPTAEPAGVAAPAGYTAGARAGEQTRGTLVDVFA